MIDADENVFRKEKVTKEDDGYYFAIVNSIKSNITKVTVHSLFIKDPGPEQNLIEGASLKLQYDLRKGGFKLNFFKDGMYLAEKVNVAENIFRKDKVTMDDQGDYFAEVNSIKSNITKVTVDAMFTSSFDQIYCIEGEELQLKCSVYSASIQVDWFKDNSNRKKADKIERNESISIDHNGKDHVLTIQNTKITDSGQYIVIAGNVRKQFPVTVNGNLK
ncbi:unnamed protein product [Mytilus edulis]|uniref:Ig-like domain-containing protein n=1 Tax=Mytilus edulis TaxID=6550 RepID=A0A8S3S5S3_MYTED|nr:unnamed protein product [Mytilus edulis]